MRRTTISQSCLIAAGMIGVATSAAIAAPTNYTLLTTIAVPTAGPSINHQPGGEFTSFDISFFDPSTRLDYVADRSNASVDIYSGSSLAFVGRATGFTGQQATTSVSGADGVLVVSSGGTHTLFAGDGNSTLKTFDVANPAAPSVKFPPISTGGNFRVDEMAFSPTQNLVLVANNADAPAFGTLVNATTGAIVHGNISIPGAAASDGLEQPVWNPHTNTFFISVPSFNGDQGGVAEIKPDGTVGRLYKFASFGIASCAPTGLALGASGHLMVGCGNAGTQTVVLDPTGSGSIVKTLAQISGSDELWFDPTLNDFFVTGTDTSKGRAFDVISDGSNTVQQSVALPPGVNAHSISVDPGNGNVFVPLPGSTPIVADALCPLGCIAVFAQVPEPGTAPILATALLGLAGVTLRRRRGVRSC